MDEGALGAVTDNRWSGRTHNPHRHGYTAALGTETIGNIHIPAAYCGIVGHKPLRGMIPTDGVVPLSPTLDHIGIVAKTADSCGRIMRVLGETARSPRVRFATRRRCKNGRP